jgi:hypothetical protein
MDNTNIDSKFYGVTEGVIYQQNERVEDLNQRIASRQFSDSPLEPNYDPRPVSTKRSRFPIIDLRASANTQKQNYPIFNTYDNFNPGTGIAPIRGYFAKVDTEAVLRNQIFSNQRFSQNVYVPTSKSDLFNVTVLSRPADQPYPLLFKSPEFDPALHPNVESTSIGRNMFFNSTRVQLRNGM